MKDLIYLISTTFDKKEDAEKLGEQLLDQRLIACAQISGPITSIYKWQGTTEQSEEYVLSVKTLEEKAELVKKTIKNLHPYETPELVGNILESYNESYFTWMKEGILDNE